MKSARTIAAALCTIAGTAGAQNLELEYVGRVVEVIDNSGVFPGIAVGQIVEGGVGLDLGAGDDVGGDIPDNLPIDLGLFLATAINANVDGRTFEGTDVIAVVANDLPLADDGSPLDFFIAQGSLPPAFPGSSFGGLLKSTFSGGPDLFSSTGIDNATALDLANLDRAEVTIEFNILNGDPNSPDVGFTQNRVTIEIVSLSSAGNRLADLVCLPDTNENGEIDFGDFNAWVSLFNAGDYRADINLDGDVTPADFSAWIAAYNRGC